jgi:hypothetical protein
MTVSAQQTSPPDVSPFADSTDLAALATAQGISPIEDFECLLGDFWPEDESADDFIAAVRQWRQEGVASER